MNPEIVRVLKQLEDNGYEAFIVGGYVRDKLLGIESNDIDICTNALPKEIINLFNINKDLSTYGVNKIITNHFNFEITTYRKEITYSNRKPVEIEYINNLIDDLKRRDFTINSICMDSNGDIIDLLNGISDLKNKKIKMIGNVENKINEDPLRILRALRFTIILDFKLDNVLKKSIKKNLKLLNELSYTRKKEELDKILTSKNAIHGLKMLKKLGVLKYLEIDYNKLNYVDDLCGMYAQLNISPNYSFTNQEKDNIEIIKNIIKTKKINKEIIFYNGLYLTQVASKILGFNQNKLMVLYNELPIKSEKELNITGDDIITILNIEPSNIINIIYTDLISNILNGYLLNEKDKLICYIINNKKRWFK